MVRDFFFWEDDANLILALPVHADRPNKLAWHYDSKGIFSVRSAYKVCREDMLRSQASANGQHSAGSADEKLWMEIWRLQCPNKVKHFF
jgi:hypothetical protein